MYIISFYGRGNCFSEKLNGSQRYRADKVKLWLGTQVCMILKSTMFSSSHSAFQAFLTYNFWPERGLWRLSLRSVVLMEQKKKKMIYYLEWGWSRGSRDHLSSVPTDSLLEKPCSLPLVRNEPKFVIAEGTWHLWFNLLILKMSTLESLKGKVICPRLLCDESVSGFAHQSSSSLQHSLGSVLWNYTRKAWFYFYIRLFKYGVAMLGTPKSASGEADFHWSSVSVTA